MSNYFAEYRKTCPSCGSTKFHKRKGFHLIKRFRCHKCKDTFFSPKKAKNMTSSNEYRTYHDIKSSKKSIIKHK